MNNSAPSTFSELNWWGDKERVKRRISSSKLTIGVGPVRHLTTTRANGGSSGTAVHTFVSGYDFADEIISGIKKTGLFDDVRFTNILESSDFDAVVTGHPTGRPDSPLADAWEMVLIALKEGEILLEEIISSPDQTNLNELYTCVGNHFPAFPGEAKKFMIKAGERMGWVVANALAKKETVE